MQRNSLLFAVALVSALWFAVAGMVWAYYAALVIAYPFGILSYLLWRKLRKDNQQRNRLIPMVLIIGLALSLGVLASLLLWG